MKPVRLLPSQNCIAFIRIQSGQCLFRQYHTPTKLPIFRNLSSKIINPLYVQML
jgi:hypothetical protein